MIKSAKSALTAFVLRLETRPRSRLRKEKKLLLDSVKPCAIPPEIGPIGFLAVPSHER